MDPQWKRDNQDGCFCRAWAIAGYLPGVPDISWVYAARRQYETLGKNRETLRLTAL
jgi:hypothetical protein